MRILTARNRRPAYASRVSSLDRWLPTLVATPLVGFVLYRRLSRAFARQPIVAWKMILRAVLLSLAALVFLAPVLLFPSAQRLEAVGLGAFVGTALALFDLQRTQIDVTPEGRFYTPHKWIQLVVTALFTGRLVARIPTQFREDAQLGAAMNNHEAVVHLQHASSPLTIALFFVFAMYNVVYYVSLLLRARSLPTT